LRRTGRFKAAVSGDPMTVEYKFQPFFTLLPYAKLMFSCNQIPLSRDDTPAFWRRWEIIEFTENFEGRADKHILRKLTTEKELEGFFNLALTGLRRLLERGDFTASASIEATRENYMRKASPLYCFIQDQCEEAEGEFVACEDFMRAYSEWCGEHGYKAKPQAEVTKEMAVVAPWVITGGKRRIEGESKRVYLNIKMRDFYSENYVGRDTPIDEWR